MKFVFFFSFWLLENDKQTKKKKTSDIYKYMKDLKDLWCFITNFYLQDKKKKKLRDESFLNGDRKLKKNSSNRVILSSHKYMSYKIPWLIDMCLSL